MDVRSRAQSHPITVLSGAGQPVDGERNEEDDESLGEIIEEGIWRRPPPARARGDSASAESGAGAGASGGSTTDGADEVDANAGGDEGRLADRTPEEVLLCVSELSAKVERTLIEQGPELRVPGPGVVSEGEYFVEDYRKRARPLKVNLDLITYYGRQQMLAGNESRAVEFYLRAIALDPRDGRAWLALARRESQRRNFDKAVELFKRGLKFCPTNVHLLQAYGVCLEKAQRPQLAMKLYRHATSLDSTHAASWVAKARLEMEDLEFAAARESFKRGAEGDPESYYVWQAWGVMEAQLENYVEARRLFTKGAEVNPRNAATYQAWACMEAKLHGAGLSGRLGGGLERAEELFERALRENPRSTYTLQAYALMESRRGNTEKALALFKRGFHRKLTDAGLLQACALMLYRVGNDAVRHPNGAAWVAQQRRSNAAATPQRDAPRSPPRDRANRANM